MLKKHRIISIMICVSMIFCLIVSTSALGATQVFSGKIVCGDNIDLSDIEVEIYSSAPKYDEDGNFLYYVETYERSVYADADGDFEFVKPSLYCSYTINVETLPANYGVSKHTQFIIPTRTNDSVTIAAISTAEADYSGGSFYAIFKAADGTEIYTDHDIIEDGESSVFVAGENLSATKQIISAENIEDVNRYTLSGTIVTNGKNYRYSKSFDISDYSETEKADLLCSLGKISEEEKYDIYSQYGEEFYSQVTPCDELETNGESRAATAYQDPDYDRTLSVTLGSNTVEVKYTASSFTNYPGKLGLFEDTLEDVYNYFCVSNGFLAPVAPTGNFCIYITSDCSEDGRTYPANTGPGSTIWIKESLVQNGNAKQALAHEFMHGIMYRYLIRNAGNWFKESFATMASMVYLRKTDAVNFIQEANFHYFKECLEDYVENYYRSLTSPADDDLYPLFSYGTLVFALCLYNDEYDPNLTENDRWETIRTLFENYDNTSPEFDSIHGTRDGTTFNFESIFDEMSAAILFPTSGNLGFEIAQMQGISSYWPTVSCFAQRIPSEQVKLNINPLANRYFSYSPSTNMGTVYLTASSTGDCLFNVYNNLTSSIIGKLAWDDVRVTLPIENFGATGANKKIIMSTTNFSISTTRSLSISISTSRPEDWP